MSNTRKRVRVQVVHLYSIPIRKRNQGGGSSQATLRHPEDTAYRCFLPDLTGFTAFRRAGPNYQRRPTKDRDSERQTSKRSSASLERIASTGHRYLPA